MSIFGSEVIQLDLSEAQHDRHALLPFVLRAEAIKLDRDVAMELRSTLVAHRGNTPVHLVLCNRGKETALALHDYPVTVGSSLLGELKAISGITVAS
jgi:DNA polymerase-3 subunit alpha